MRWPPDLIKTLWMVIMRPFACEVEMDANSKQSTQALKRKASTEEAQRAAQLLSIDQMKSKISP